MLMDCLLPYKSDTYFYGSLSEPMSCIVGTYHAMYHTKAGSYVHEMGIVEGGTCAILAGAGPMGMGCIDYLVNGPRQPKLLVVRRASGFRESHCRSFRTWFESACSCFACALSTSSFRLRKFV